MRFFSQGDCFTRTESFLKFQISRNMTTEPPANREGKNTVSNVRIHLLPEAETQADVTFPRSSGRHATPPDRRRERGDGRHVLWPLTLHSTLFQTSFPSVSSTTPLRGEEGRGPSAQRLRGTRSPVTEKDTRAVTAPTGITKALADPARPQSKKRDPD